MTARVKVRAPVYVDPDALDQWKQDTASRMAKDLLAQVERGVAVPVVRLPPGALPIPVPAPVRPAPSVAMAEVLGLPQQWFADLPLASTLLIAAHDGRRLLYTTSQTAYQAALSEQVPAFVGSELAPIALAAEHDRACPEVLASWCDAKLREPGFRVTPHNALADIARSERHTALGWSIGAVLRAYGAELLQVCTGQQVPAW